MGVIGATIPFTIGAGEEPKAPVETPGGELAEEGFLTYFARDLYRGLEPLAVPQPTYDPILRGWCNAVGSMFREVEECVRATDTQDLWRRVLDVDTCPGFLLPFLGQCVGVRVKEGTEEEQRQQIREESAYRRGRPSAIIAAVESTLTGAKRVRLVERSESAWTMEVITEPEETPNIAFTEAAGRLAKPGGIVMTFVLSSLPLINEGTRTIDASEGIINTATLANIT